MAQSCCPKCCVSDVSSICCAPTSRISDESEQQTLCNQPELCSAHIGDQRGPAFEDWTVQEAPSCRTRKHKRCHWDRSNEGQVQQLYKQPRRFISEDSTCCDNVDVSSVSRNYKQPTCFNCCANVRPSYGEIFDWNDPGRSQQRYSRSYLRHMSPQSSEHDDVSFHDKSSEVLTLVDHRETSSSERLLRNIFREMRSENDTSYALEQDLNHELQQIDKQTSCTLEDDLNSEPQTIENPREHRHCHHGHKKRHAKKRAKKICSDPEIKTEGPDQENSSIAESYPANESESGPKDDCSSKDGCSVKSGCLNNSCCLKDKCCRKDGCCPKEGFCTKDGCCPKDGCCLKNGCCFKDDCCLKNGCCLKDGCCPKVGFCLKNGCCLKGGCCLKDRCGPKDGCCLKDLCCLKNGCCLKDNCCRKKGCCPKEGCCSKDSCCLKDGCCFNDGCCPPNGCCLKKNGCCTKDGCFIKDACCLNGGCCLKEGFCLNDGCCRNKRSCLSKDGCCGCCLENGSCPVNRRYTNGCCQNDDLCPLDACCLKNSCGLKDGCCRRSSRCLNDGCSPTVVCFREDECCPGDGCCDINDCCPNDDLCPSDGCCPMVGCHKKKGSRMNDCCPMVCSRNSTCCRKKGRCRMDTYCGKGDCCPMVDCCPVVDCCPTEGCCRRGSSFCALDAEHCDEMACQNSICQTSCDACDRCVRKSNDGKVVVNENCCRCQCSDNQGNALSDCTKKLAQLCCANNTKDCITEALINQYYLTNVTPNGCCATDCCDNGIGRQTGIRFNDPCCYQDVAMDCGSDDYLEKINRSISMNRARRRSGDDGRERPTRCCFKNVCCFRDVATDPCFDNGCQRPTRNNTICCRREVATDCCSDQYFCVKSVCNCCCGTETLCCCEEKPCEPEPDPEPEPEPEPEQEPEKVQAIETKLPAVVPVAVVPEVIMDVQRVESVQIQVIPEEPECEIELEDEAPVSEQIIVQNQSHELTDEIECELKSDHDIHVNEQDNARESVNVQANGRDSVHEHGNGHENARDSVRTQSITYDNARDSVLGHSNALENARDSVRVHANAFDSARDSIHASAHNNARDSVLVHANVHENVLDSQPNPELVQLIQDGVSIFVNAIRSSFTDSTRTASMGHVEPAGRNSMTTTVGTNVRSMSGEKDDVKIEQEAASVSRKVAFQVADHVGEDSDQTNFTKHRRDTPYPDETYDKVTFLEDSNKDKTSVYQKPRRDTPYPDETYDKVTFLGDGKEDKTSAHQRQRRDTPHPDETYGKVPFQENGKQDKTSAYQKPRRDTAHPDAVYPHVMTADRPSIKQNSNMPFLNEDDEQMDFNDLELDSPDHPGDAEQPDDADLPVDGDAMPRRISQPFYDNFERNNEEGNEENQQDDQEMDTQNETPESSSGRPSLQGARNSLTRNSMTGLNRASFGATRKSLGSARDSLILKPLSEEEHESEEDSERRRTSTIVRFADYPEYNESNNSDADPFIYFAGFESPNPVKSLFQTNLTKSTDHKVIVTKDALASALWQEPISLINVTSRSKSLGRMRSVEAAMQSKIPDPNHSVDAALRTKTSDPTVSVNSSFRSKIRNSVRTFNHTKRSTILVPIKPIDAKTRSKASDPTVSARGHTRSKISDPIVSAKATARSKISNPIVSTKATSHTKISNSNVSTKATARSRISDPTISAIKATQSKISDPVVSAKANSQFMISDPILATKNITRSRISDLIVSIKHSSAHNVKVDGKSVDESPQAKIKRSSTYMSANTVMQPESYQDIKTFASNSSHEIVTAGLSRTFRHSGLYTRREGRSSDLKSNVSADSTGKCEIDAQIENSEIESVSEHEYDNEADNLTLYRVQADLNRNIVVEDDHGRNIHVTPHNKEHRSKEAQFNQKQRPRGPNKTVCLPEETPDNGQYRPQDDALAIYPDREPVRFTAGFLVY